MIDPDHQESQQGIRIESKKLTPLDLKKPKEPGFLYCPLINDGEFRRNPKSELEATLNQAMRINTAFGTYVQNRQIPGSVPEVQQQFGRMLGGRFRKDLISLAKSLPTLSRLDTVSPGLSEQTICAIKYIVDLCGTYIPPARPQRENENDYEYQTYLDGYQMLPDAIETIKQFQAGQHTRHAAEAPAPSASPVEKTREIVPEISRFDLFTQRAKQYVEGNLGDFSNLLYQVGDAHNNYNYKIATYFTEIDEPRHYIYYPDRPPKLPGHKANKELMDANQEVILLTNPVRTYRSASNVSTTITHSIHYLINMLQTDSTVRFVMLKGASDDQLGNKFPETDPAFTEGVEVHFASPEEFYRAVAGNPILQGWLGEMAEVQLNDANHHQIIKSFMERFLYKRRETDGSFAKYNLPPPNKNILRRIFT